MISGVVPHDALPANPQGFAACGSSEFYPNSGIEALVTETLDDYLSARKLSSSILCFEPPSRSPARLNSLGFVWYSPSEAASRIKVTALGASSTPNDEVIIDIPAPKIVRGLAVSHIQMPEMRPAKRFQLTLLEGGTQKRLLLRHLRAGFADNARTGTHVSPGRFDEIFGKIHTSVTYGPRALPASIDNLDQLRASILAHPVADNAIFAFLFADAIDGMHRWQIFDLVTRDTRMHSVVEIYADNDVQTADPTLGIIYKCSVESMISGFCSDPEYKARVVPNPILQGYHGAGFFYGAHVTRKYTKLEELLDGYQQ
jgi:hypothetical protein